MTTPPDGAATHPPDQTWSRWWGRAPLGLRRSRSDRLLAGVAGGLAARLRLDPVYVRAAVVLLSLAAGVGLVAYLLLWAVVPEAPDDLPAPPPSADARRPLGFGCIVLALLLVCREVGLWFDDALMWPLALAVVGSTVIAARGDGTDNARMTGWAHRMSRDPVGSVLGDQVSGWRLALGALLIAVGGGAVLATSASFAALGSVIVAVVVSAAGLALVFGPLLARLARGLTDERRERIRSEERADMAAHLHDSVLQTLALIQRSPDAAEMSTLARVQERELRAWLFGVRDQPGIERVEASLTDLATRVEQQHNVPVEVVVVGDAPLDESTTAVVLACGEAMLNAARHSGAAKVSVYVEIEPEVVTAYVTDEGRGFDVRVIPGDRGGIAESVRGRIERAGGIVAINSIPGEGTEVRMTLARRDRGEASP